MSSCEANIRLAGVHYTYLCATGEQRRLTEAHPLCLCTKKGEIKAERVRWTGSLTRVVQREEGRHVATGAQ